MKRWKQFVCALTAGVMALVFTACGAKAPEQMEKRATEKAGNAFTATATIHYQGVTSKVVVDKKIPISYTLTFSEPKALEGMKVVFEEENVGIQYGAMSLNVDPNQLSSNAAVKMLVSTINTITADSGLNITMEENVVSVTGTMDTGEFTLRMDKKTGNFLSLLVPDNDFSMEFEDFQFFS